MNTTTTELDQKLKMRVVIAIMFLAAVQLSAMNVSAGLGMLLAQYSKEGYGATAIQMVTSVPALTIIIAAMLCPWLCKTFGTKKTILFGMVIMCFGGTMPTFIYGYEFLIIMHIVKGFGLGIIAAQTSGGAITRSFEGIRERDKYIGWTSVSKYIGGMIMTYTGGLLAAAAFNLVFLVNLFTVPMFIGVLVFMPKDSQIYSHEVVRDADSRGRQKVKFPIGVWKVGIMAYIWMALFNVMMTNQAMLIQAKELGTAVHAGYGAVIYTFSSMVVSLFYVYIAKVFGRKLMGVAYVICGIGIFGLGFLQDSLALIYLWTVVAGIGVGLSSPSTAIEATLYTAGLNKVSATGFVFGCLQLGLFTSPFLAEFISNAFYGADGPEQRYAAASLLLIPYAILILIRQIIVEKKEAGKDTVQA